MMIELEKTTPTLYVRRTADLPEAAAHQRRKEEAPNRQWFKARLLPALPPTPRSSPRCSLLSPRVRETVRHAEMLIGFTWSFFRAQYRSHFCRSSCELQLLVPCSPQLLIFTWFLVTAFGMFGFCTHCKWQSPSSHLWWLKRKRRLPRGPVGLQSHPNPAGLPPQSLTASKTPRLAQEKQAAAPPARIRATLVPTCSPGPCGVGSRSF